MSLLETVVVNCPFCGEPNKLVIDTSVPQQKYIEDCFVCCRPMQVWTETAHNGEVKVTVRSEDELF